LLIEKVKFLKLLYVVSPANVEVKGNPVNVDVLQYADYVLIVTLVITELTEIMFGKRIVSLSEFDKRALNVVKVAKSNKVPAIGLFEEVKVIL
jgi:hypothetical protein